MLTRLFFATVAFLALNHSALAATSTIGDENVSALNALVAKQGGNVGTCTNVKVTKGSMNNKLAQLVPYLNLSFTKKSGEVYSRRFELKETSVLVTEERGHNVSFASFYDDIGFLIPAIFYFTFDGEIITDLNVQSVKVGICQ